MPTPAYTNITGQIGPKLLQGTVTTGQTLLYTGGASIPDIPAVNFGKSAPGVNSLGNINILGFVTGTATAAPASIDLTAVKDPDGTAVNFARVRAVEILNYATTDGYTLLLDGTATNAWSRPFNGIATAKLLIPAGATLNGQPVPGGVLLWGANLTGLVTSGTSKLIVLDPGANTIAYRVALLGVDA